MASEYKAQLLAVETKLSKDPDNEELLQLKADLVEMIELCECLDEEEEPEQQPTTRAPKDVYQSKKHQQNPSTSQNRSDDLDQKMELEAPKIRADTNNHIRRPLSEAELLAKKREKNKKKKAKLREKIKEQLDTAESEKQSWQSFANKKGLKGIAKKSIFASPCSVTGKVGVGTNGIADAPSVGAATSSITSLTKQKY